MRTPARWHALICGLAAPAAHASGSVGFLYVLFGIALIHIAAFIWLFAALRSRAIWIAVAYAACLAGAYVFVWNYDAVSLMSGFAIFLAPLVVPLWFIFRRPRAR